MTTVKKPTTAAPAAPTTAAKPAAKSGTLKVAERPQLAADLSKVLGRPIDPKGLSGRWARDGAGGSFFYKDPKGRAGDISGMFTFKAGVFATKEAMNANYTPGVSGQLYPKPTTGFSTGSTTTPAVVTNPTGTPVAPPAPAKPTVPTVAPITLPALTLPALSGDTKAQASQYLDVLFRAESREKYAGVFSSWADSNRLELGKAESDFASQSARAEYMKKYEPYNFMTYDMTAKATGARADGFRTALGENLQKSAQSAAEGRQLRDALKPWTTQGEAAVEQLMKDDPAAFVQLRNSLMIANGLNPPATPPGTGPNGAPLTLSPNGNQYGADAQGHANLLAADPSGSRWSYVNPTPVTSQTNPWSDTGRLP